MTKQITGIIPVFVCGRACVCVCVCVGGGLSMYDNYRQSDDMHAQLQLTNSNFYFLHAFPIRFFFPN